jgi:hypothetical protein
MGHFYLDIRCDGQAWIEPVKVLESQSLAEARKEAVELALCVAKGRQPASEVLVSVRDDAEPVSAIRVSVEKGRCGACLVLRFA